MPWLWQTARDAWSTGPLSAAATSANASFLWVRVGMLLGSSNARVIGGVPVSQQEREQRSSGAAAARQGVGSTLALPALLRVGCLQAGCQGK